MVENESCNSFMFSPSPHYCPTTSIVQQQLFQLICRWTSEVPGFILAATHNEYYYHNKFGYLWKQNSHNKNHHNYTT